MDSEPLPSGIDELSVFFTNDREIQLLNRFYRSKNKPTDVLSFSQREGETTKIPHPLLGDIVISLETAAVQAVRYRRTPGDEILRLLVHGVLHLFGYDHEKVPRRRAEAMRRLERKLMRKFGSEGESLVERPKRRR